MKHLLKLLMLLVAFVAVSCTNGNTDKTTQYIVTFDLDGGNGTPSVKVDAGAKVAAPNTPELEGSTFGGWYTDDSYYMEWDFSNETIIQNTTIYAKWMTPCTISFETNGGEQEIKPLVGDFRGKTISAPESPTKDEFAFGGWYTDTDFLEKWDFGNRNVDNSMTLYAKWVAEGTTVNVSISYMDGTSSTSYDLPVGSLITEEYAKRNPTLEGFRFLWWADDNYPDTIWDLDKDTVTEDFTLEVQWAEIYTVSFLDTENEVVTTDEVINGEKVYRSSLTDDDNRECVGWYLDADLTQEYDFDNTTYTEDFTLYPKMASEMTITLMNDDDVVIGEYNIYPGDNIYFSDPISNKNPYWAFVGWFTEDDIEWDFDKPITETITLYAKYEDKPIEIDTTLSYEDYYNNDTDRTEYIFINDDYKTTTKFVSYAGATIPTEFTPAEPTSYTHNFLGWKRDGEDWDFATSIVPNDSDLYIDSMWERKGDGAAAELYNWLTKYKWGLNEMGNIDVYTQASYQALAYAMNDAEEKIKAEEVSTDNIEDIKASIEAAKRALVIRTFGTTADVKLDESMAFDCYGNLIFVEGDEPNYILRAISADDEMSNEKIEVTINRGSDCLESQLMMFAAAPNSGATILQFTGCAAGSGAITFSTASGYSESMPFRVYSKSDFRKLFYAEYNAFVSKDKYAPSDSDVAGRISSLGNLFSWDDNSDLIDRLYNINREIPLALTIKNIGGNYHVYIPRNRFFPVSDASEMNYNANGPFPYGVFSRTEKTDDHTETTIVTINSDGTGSINIEYSDMYFRPIDVKMNVEIQGCSTATTKAVWTYITEFDGGGLE